MRLSDDRVSHIAHIIMDGIWRDDLADFADERMALKEIKESITNYLRVEDEAELSTIKKIRSLKRYIPEGSREWEILYKQYYNEAIDRKGF